MQPANVRILVVDDDDDIQVLLKRAAEPLGYELVPASDGRLALNLAATERFDLILLDINMPGLDGRDVLLRLKQNPATLGIPVLVHSVRGGQYDRQLVLELGAEEFIEKSSDGRLTMSQIRRLFETLRDRAARGSGSA